MLTSDSATRNAGIPGRRLLSGCLVLLLCLLLPATAFAEPPEPDYEGPAKCAGCHPAQAATWEDSPHARALTAVEASLQVVCSDEGPQIDCECLRCHTTHFDPGKGSYAHAGVTCEACHGPYVPNHPHDGVMQLPVDASGCQDCHATTYGEWHETAHAGVGVQCTSCHLPHSQETRLDDEALCGSCHREELSDWAHQSAGVTCTDCHLSSRAVPEGVADVRVGGGGMAPDHSFEHVVESCTNCHGQSIHQQVFHETSHEIDSAQLSTMVERAGELARQLEDAKRTNRTLQTLSVVSLGFGLGAGGVLGMIFVLVVGYISQGRRQT